MCDRHRARAERCRGRERSHPPWSPRPRNAHEGPWDGLYPAGYKLVRRVPHARKGLALDRKKLQTNEENICDLFDDVTDLGAPSSPAPLAHRFAAAGLDRAPKSVTRRLSRSLSVTENTPLTAAHSYKSRMGAVAWGLWPTPRFPSPLISRVEGWRADSVRDTSTVPRFQPPPRRTQHADFPHCAPPFASCRGL